VRTEGDRQNVPLPKYSELPEARGGAKCGWHVFGEGDQVGLLNLQTPQRVVAASRLIQSGEVFSLNVDLGAIDPPLFGRGAPRHEIIDEGVGCAFDDRIDNYWPQAASQWDSLAHVGYAPDSFYNGATASEVARGEKNTIEHWARKGIAGRAVVIDVDALYGGAGQGFDPSEPRRVSVAELEAARRAAGVEWQPGDIMLLHTGFLAWYIDQDRAVRERMATDDITSIGLDRGPEMLSYLWDSRIAGIAADNPAVEAVPFDLSSEARPYGFLHTCLIGQLGMALGELWWLDDLACACRRDARYEVFLTSAPIHVVGGVGSPANALAIR
jgi:hypothetical protein